MMKLFVLSHRPIKPGVRGDFTRAELEASLDLSRVEEKEIQFDQSFLYRASSAEEMVRQMSHSVYGPNYPVSAREFTDEEYKKAFEKSSDRKVEWLGDAIGDLALARELFGNMSNKKLNMLVARVAGKTIPAVSYK